MELAVVGACQRVGHRDPVAADELQMRAFWRRWQTMLNGGPAPATYGDTPPAADAQACPHDAQCTQGDDHA